MKMLALFLLALAFVAPLMAQQATYVDLEAELSHRRYTAAIKQAQAEFDKKAAEAKKQHISELAKVMEKATKSGELNDAVQIRDAIAKLEQGEQPVANASPAGQMPDGQYRFYWKPLAEKPSVLQFEIKSGKMIQSDGNGTSAIKVVDGCFAMNWSNGTRKNSHLVSPTPNPTKFLIERRTGHDNYRGAAEGIGVCEKIK